MDSLARLKRDIVDLNLESSRIFTIDYTNPFPFLFRTAPPLNKAGWWHIGVTISKNEKLRGENIVEHACVLVSIVDPDHTGEAELLKAALAGTIERDYEMMRQAKYGAIYRRKSGCLKR